MGRIKDHFREARAGIECGRHNQYGQLGHLGHRSLDLRRTLIAGSVLLQAGILVDRLAAIALVIRVRKRHGWRLRSLDASLCNADRLREKHRCRN